MKTKQIVSIVRLNENGGMMNSAVMPSENEIYLLTVGKQFVLRLDKQSRLEEKKMTEELWFDNLFTGRRKG